MNPRPRERMKTNTMIVIAGVLIIAMMSAVVVAIACAPKAFTIDHDGHRWVKGASGGALTHHPDCPCMKAASH